MERILKGNLITIQGSYGCCRCFYDSSVLQLPIFEMYDELEDNKGVVRIRISKKNRQHNGQKKKYKISCSTSDTRRVNLVILPLVFVVCA